MEKLGPVNTRLFGQLSEIVGAGINTFAKQDPGWFVTFIGLGQVMLGGLLSITCTVKDCVAVLPSISLAV